MNIKILFMLILLFGCDVSVVSENNLFKEYVEIYTNKSFCFGSLNGNKLEIEYLGWYKEIINNASFDVVLYRERGITYSHRLMYGTPIKILFYSYEIFFDYCATKEYFGLRIKSVNKL